jgi:hypothetical protein
VNIRYELSRTMSQLMVRYDVLCTDDDGENVGLKS